MPKYIVDYERGQGRTPWAVYRVVPIGLCSPGRIWLTNFATKAEAEAWCAEHEPVEAWQLEIEADKYRPENR